MAEGTLPRRAVVIMNLGGPDSQEAVQPFLFNLFYDPAIIDLPNPFRWLIAKLISARRAPVARDIYSKIGGGSPIVENTQAQLDALERLLNARSPDAAWRVFMAMRYWHPMSAEAAEAVKTFDPESVVLLPLYPHFSTTTTRSSLDAWHESASTAGLQTKTSAVCCYPLADGFVAAVTDLLAQAVTEMGDKPFRILFSAHGLPKKIIARGDSYQWQVEQSVAAVVARAGGPKLDWSVCYQSRVGPLEWIGPSTDDEIRRVGAEGKNIILVPITFVSEHSETLVELDMEYAQLAESAGVSNYIRVPTVATHESYMAALGELVLGAEGRVGSGPVCSGSVCSGSGGRLCPAAFGTCLLGESDA